MKKRSAVISCSIADSGDYDFLIEEGVHNALIPLWSWAENQGIKLSFVKSIETDLATVSLRLRIDAVFDNPAHLALFKLSFSELPYNQFTMKGMQPIFLLQKNR